MLKVQTVGRNGMQVDFSKWSCYMSIENFISLKSQKPMRTGHKQGKMQLTCFSKIGTTPEAEQLCLLSCLCSEKQERSLPVTSPSLRATALPCSPVGIKRPTEEGAWGFFALEGFFWALAFGFCFGLFGMGSF
jgi:hypothetical protein